MRNVVSDLVVELDQAVHGDSHCNGLNDDDLCFMLVPTLVSQLSLHIPKYEQIRDCPSSGSSGPKTELPRR